MADANDVCAHCGGPKAVRNPSGACDHLYWPDCLSYEARIANGFEPTRDQILERQQQVIDLLMKAVEPFVYEAEILDLQTRPSGEALIAIGELRMKHLRRAREAKVEAEKILNSTPSTAL